MCTSFRKSKKSEIKIECAFFMSSLKISCALVYMGVVKDFIKRVHEMATHRFPVFWTKINVPFNSIFHTFWSLFMFSSSRLAYRMKINHALILSLICILKVLKTLNTPKMWSYKYSRDICWGNCYHCNCSLNKEMFFWKLKKYITKE